MSGDNLGNRREALGWLAGGGIVATALLAINRTCKAEDGVPLSEVPQAAKAAANRAIGREPNARWLWAGKVEDSGKTAFELDGKDTDKRDVTVLVTAAGAVVECETELKNPARDVPAKVLNAVKAFRPVWKNFKPTEAQEIRQGDNLKGPKDGDRVYDLRGTIGAKERDIQVQVTAEGEVLEAVVEVADSKNVPDVVTRALKKAKPKFKWGAVYAIHEYTGRGKKESLIAYQFEGEGPKGRDRTISVSSDGKQVEIVGKVED